MDEQTSESVAKKLVESLQSDLRSLSNEAKKKFPQIKEASESASIKLRTVNMNQPVSAVMKALCSINNEIMHPFIMATKTKYVKLVPISLTALQRLASHKLLDPISATTIVNELWNLMESEIEELRLLQTAALLVTSSKLVTGSVLSKCLVVCFRLNFAKDSFVINTASATVRQLVAQIFERLQNEKLDSQQQQQSSANSSDLRAPVKVPPKSLSASGADAFMLFQDLCRLVSAEQPFWLLGITEMTRTLGLDLLEMVLTQNIRIFTKIPEFAFLTKELVCPLLIKLFSPNLKYYQNQQRQQLMGMAQSSMSTSSSSMTGGHSNAADPTGPVEKPYFPITMRLMRLVSVLISRYGDLLSTECEIFLSLLVKFLENDKIEWQRALAIEIINRIVNQRRLLWSFCENYDMKMHSSKILKDLTSSLENFVQSFLTSSTDKPSSSDGEQTDMLSQPGFVYRGNYIPYISPASPGSSKFTFLEMVEKVEPPQPPEGYTLSLSFACITELVLSTQQLIEDDDNATSNKTVCDHLISSMQNSLLSSLSLFFEASVDENLTDICLKSLTAMLKIACKLQLPAVRDAYLATLCKAALPPSYFSTIIPGGSDPKLFNSVEVHASNSMKSAPSNVVAVSTPCPTIGCPTSAMNTPVMLTAKNLQAVRSLLICAQINGAFLQQSWHLVLLTVQHLVWLLNLKPTTSGSLKPSQSAETGSASNTILTTAAMADVPVLTNMLSRVFETTSVLDIVAFHHVLNALCSLSSDSMQIAVDGREPSYFAVSKLMETTLYNLHRSDQFFKPVSSHFVELCSQPYQKLREWGGIALTTVVKSALAGEFEFSEFKNADFQRLMLTPLCSLNENAFEDIRQQQIECILQILRAKGQVLAPVLWPSIIESIGTIPKNIPNDVLIRHSFQAVQLLTSDILPYLPPSCLLSLIEIVSRFGCQLKDLNISLSAIGVLWNISDFLYRSSAKIFDGSVSPDELWLSLYTYLSALCVDSRPAVRKSACQTLFSTISSHGDKLQSISWSHVLWQVLFPLLDKVKTFSFSASTAKVDLSTSGGTNILIHHSRDTESKQWAETAVLTLAGACRVFASKRNILSTFSDYSRAWSTLLENVEIFAICTNSEISTAALRSFLELLSNKIIDVNEPEVLSSNSASGATGANVIVNQPGKVVKKSTIIEKMGKNNEQSKSSISTPNLNPEMWSTAWKVWLKIATFSTDTTRLRVGDKIVNLPSPAYYLALLELFFPLFINIKSFVDLKELSAFLTILYSIVVSPVASEAAIYILPTATDVSPIQESVLNCVTFVYQESVSANSRLRPVLPELFSTTLTFVGFCCRSPISVFDSLDNRNGQTDKINKNEACFVYPNLIPFAEHSLKLAIEFYSNTAHLTEVIEAGVAPKIVKALSTPLSLKYQCPSVSTWKLSLHCLLTIIRLSVAIAKDPKFMPHFETFWLELSDCLEKFLFSKHDLPPNLSLEERKKDEFMDCQVIEVIRADILPYAKILPITFVARIMDLLHRGSIHDYDPKDVLSLDVGRRLRTDLSRTCFEALLDASRAEPDLVACSSPNSSSVGAAALTSLLRRCRDVISAYPVNERQAAGTPLPRHRVAEMTQVLTAIGTLIESLRRQTAAGGEPQRSQGMWNQLIEIYPILVDSVPCRQPEVQQALMNTLKAYAVMLGCPSKI